MPDDSTKGKELKAMFFRDFLPGEQRFFLRQARECVNEKSFPISEDLFNYCCFLTLRERVRLIQPQDGEWLMRFMLVESRREIESELKALEKRLEARKRRIAAEEGRLLLEFPARLGHRPATEKAGWVLIPPAFKCPP
jgi:hypothetical protein